MPKKCDRNGAAKVRKVVKVHLGEETFHSAGVQARGRKCASVYVWLKRLLNEMHSKLADCTRRRRVQSCGKFRVAHVSGKYSS